MLIALSILLVLAVLVVLAYPIVRQARGEQSPVVSTSSAETLADLLAERSAAFQAIRDLQFDHEVGKISDADLVVYEAQLKQNAAETLRRLDAWETGADGALGLSIERRVRARRAALVRADARPCPQCGRPLAAADRFCTNCGRAVEAAPRAATVSVAAVCPKCERPVAADDRFCPRCGQPLAELPRGYVPPAQSA